MLSQTPTYTFSVDPGKHNILYVDGHSGMANLLAIPRAITLY